MDGSGSWIVGISNSSLQHQQPLAPYRPHIYLALGFGAGPTLQGKEGLVRTTDFGVTLDKSFSSPPCHLENRNNSTLQPYRGLLINVSSFWRALEFHLVLLIQLAKVPGQKLMGISFSNRIMWLSGAEHSAGHSSY